MMNFFTNGSLVNTLAPRLEVGQEALYDALRSRDSKRATRIIKRIAQGEQGGAGSRGGAGQQGVVSISSSSGRRAATATSPRDQEVLYFAVD